MVYSIRADRCDSFNKITSPQNSSTLPGHFEVSQVRLMKIFRDICEMHKKDEYEAILIASQMHGFVVADENNKPLTDYISWQDQRAAITDIENFSNITGMKNRIGLPIHNLAHMIDVEKKFNNTIKILTLPELLSNVDGKTENIVHNSMIAATGFYDIHKECLSEEIIGLIEHDILLNKNTADIEVAGYYENIPIYVGIGDMQAAIRGVDTGENDAILVNVGTGSQVSVVSDTKICPPGIEYRPYIGDRHLHTITHIPAGRALNTLIKPFQEMGIDCWSKMRDFSIETIANSSLEVDFAVFESATGYTDGGFIKGIKENNFNVDNILASFVRQMCLQYVRYIKKFDYKPGIRWVILSGGIPKSIPALPSLITVYTEKSCITSVSDIDETLYGLSKIARTHANR
jgi:sedoheptulokinase